MSKRTNKIQIKNNEELIKKEIDKLKVIKNDISKSNFEKCYYCVNVSWNFLYKIIKIVIRISGVYLLWILLHFFASYLYTKLCVPTTLLGLLMSPFLTATPHCQGLRWVIYNGANIINNMWIVIGTWLCANIMVLNKNIDS